MKKSVIPAEAESIGIGRGDKPLSQSEGGAKEQSEFLEGCPRGVFKLSRRREVLVGRSAAHSSSHVREVRIQNVIDYTLGV